ncbi:MAG: hypothetical protein GF383_14025 [Candidatus Lokiarchaeota archaeon]|nr:hypothetical protein [Candidatus Lokiarchaeota archaeon]MBD3342445.1 hypothetical protein [Candidatus Lokiarchaeota archaeon]
MASEYSQEKVRFFSKDEMENFYFSDPTSEPVEKILEESEIRYFYFEKDLELSTETNQLLCGCLLKNNAVIVIEGAKYNLDKFDFFFLPPEKDIKIKVNPGLEEKYKICLYSYTLERIIKADFGVYHYSTKEFIGRGKKGSEKRMPSYSSVWTAIRNTYFMAGFTKIPADFLSGGVITSVNIVEESEGEDKIHPKIHPNYPEIYLMCIDDKNYGLTQYLINKNNESICKDLKDGDGVFFPGDLEHCNFARPINKEISRCMYMWIIPTYGLTSIIKPSGLEV